jgi:hypothetical protein
MLGADRLSGAGGARQRSAPGGSTKRDGVRGPALPLSWTREPCKPDLDGVGTVASGSPPCATIHAMTASKSAPSARIAARSMTVPPEGWARASRVTRDRIASSSTRSSLSVDVSAEVVQCRDFDRLNRPPRRWSTEAFSGSLGQRPSGGRCVAPGARLDRVDHAALAVAMAQTAVRPAQSIANDPGYAPGRIVRCADVSGTTRARTPTRRVD